MRVFIVLLGEPAIEIFPLNPEELGLDVVMADPIPLEPVHFVQRDYQYCHGLDIRFAQAQTAWMEEMARKQQDMICEVAKIAVAAYELHREQEPLTIYKRPTVEQIPQRMGYIIPTERSRGPPSKKSLADSGRA